MMRYRIRKQVISAICILACGVNLAACAKTPEKKIVVDKSEGLSKENILPKETDTPKDLKIPEHWQERMERSDGYVTVEADCQIQIPKIYNTPVYSYEMRHMTDKLLKKLCDYFSDGDPLYKEPAMTKEELQAQKDDIINMRGQWAWEEGNDISPMTARIDELIEKAPEEEKRQHIEAKLVEPQQLEVESVNEKGTSASRMYSKYYYETEEKIGFAARVDKGQEVNPMIRAINYKDKLGSTSNFLYSQGTFIDEKWMEKNITSQEILEFHNEYYDNYLERLKIGLAQEGDGIIQKEDALEEADKVLEALSLKGYGVTDCFKATGSPESVSWGYLDEENQTLTTGYSIYYAPKAGDLVGYEQPFQRPYEEVPETIYAPSFSTEGIHMIITKEGLQLFEWTNLAKKKEAIAENTKLLSFDEIKEKLADHLFYTIISSFSEGKEQGCSFHYKVVDVQLRAANIPAYEDQEAVWLAPAWVFKVKYDMVLSALGTKKNEETVVLNAIDGGYVMPKVDHRLGWP